MSSRFFYVIRLRTLHWRAVLAKLKKQHMNMMHVIRLRIFFSSSLYAHWLYIVKSFQYIWQTADLNSMICKITIFKHSVFFPLRIIVLFEFWCFCLHTGLKYTLCHHIDWLQFWVFYLKFVLLRFLLPVSGINIEKSKSFNFILQMCAFAMSCKFTWLQYATKKKSNSSYRKLHDEEKKNNQMYFSTHVNNHLQKLN